MRIFLISTITGILGFIAGISFVGTDIWGCIFGLLGFSFPYAIVLEGIYKKVNNIDNRKDDI